MAFLHLIYLCIIAGLCAVECFSRSLGIPSYPFTTSGNGVYSISNLKSILVDNKFAESRDTSGETLIPPSLHQFAATFAADFHDILGINVTVSVVAETQPDSIFLTIQDQPSYEYASGEASAEGYTFEVTSSGITVSGASSLGVWWATRSLLQQSILSQGAIPWGKAVDVPGWKTRGMMLDAARHYYPPEFIKELCAYMSFFKQNVLHLHLSDNLFNNPTLYSREQTLSLYARFRLWSDSPELEGLNKYRNESYTRSDFDNIQSTCVARGVTILPEIEAPGHALPIVQWKPELGLTTDLSLLNISHPGTISTVRTIWSHFLDWFQTKTVHIGADEYTGPVTEYNSFVNEIASFIRTTASKSVLIWGTFPPKANYQNISKDVSIQHWEFFEDNPLHDYIENGYSVLNSDDTFYVVTKWSRSYPQSINISKTFHGNPATGGPWQPNVFDTRNSSNNPERSNKYLLGAVAPLWNDYGANASVYSEVYYAWRDGIPALADKQWGGNLTEAEFHQVFPILHPLIPGQNLERTIPSETSTILQYDSSSWAPWDRSHISADSSDVFDESGNEYTGTTNCTTTTKTQTLRLTPDCSLRTPLQSKGRNYTLSIRLKLDDEAQSKGQASKDITLLTGADSTLMLTPTLTLFASGNYYRLNTTTVPRGKWVDIVIRGRGERTFGSIGELSIPSSSLASREKEKRAQVTGGLEEEFQAVLGVDDVMLVRAPIAIEAPIAVLGGEWSGEVASLVLTSEA
ncbi:glycoside hydrolase family 20 protein [Xylariaceae sp. FL0594]|nr:glycoside hydrolase family 20 protein [Xylariaceae sp. FL0594]